MKTMVSKEETDARDELYYHYNFFQTFRNVMKQISSTTKFIEVVDIIPESVAKAIGVRGSALMLLDRKTRVLESVSSYGLSDRYLQKGPVLADKSISEGMDGIPVCVDTVSDDPRIQYPDEAVKEGISSILSVPIPFKGKVIGLLRIYASIPTEFSYDDIEFVQGLAELAGIVIEYNRLLRGAKHSLDVLKEHRKNA